MLLNSTVSTVLQVCNLSQIHHSLKLSVTPFRNIFIPQHDVLYQTMIRQIAFKDN